MFIKTACLVIVAHAIALAGAYIFLKKWNSQKHEIKSQIERNVEEEIIAVNKLTNSFHFDLENRWSK